MSQQVARAFAPGRVNLIGEHTDYNFGLALPFAIQAGVTVTATELSRPMVQVLALDLGEHDSFEVGDIEPGSGWRAFARGAVAELRSAGFTVRGARLEITGDLKRGAGLSSSAALTLALCLSLIGLAGEDPPQWVELAKLTQRVENDWVGSSTGLLDQFASLRGETGQAMLIDFRELTLAPVPLELGDYRLVTLDSGQRRDNAASLYNRRREECFEAAHRMGVESLRDALIQDLHMLPDELAGRARHVIGENGRVQQAAEALESGDFERLGRLLDASHAGLRADFEVSTAPVEAAVAQLKHAGALGARLIGAGFGGHVLGLMPPHASLPEGTTVVSPGPGAHLLV